jgi:AraC-like DNA-binding protein
VEPRSTSNRRVAVRFVRIDTARPAAPRIGPGGRIGHGAPSDSGSGSGSGLGSGSDEADARMAGLAEALLYSVRPERDPVAEQVAALVARITDDPGLRRVDELCVASGLSVRTLQRLFADYVGVSPKWVMRRARLHEAAERADSGEPVDWAELASDLGYADQAHLSRDFTVTIGIPPTRYATPATSLASMVSLAGIVRRASGARSRAPSRAALMSLMTAARSDLSRAGTI